MKGVWLVACRVFFFFFFNDTATTEIYTLSLHDALPICVVRRVLIPQFHAAQPAAPTEQMCAMSDGGHVLDFDAVLVGEGERQGRAASSKGVQDGRRG